jgi:hypothetical protein
MGPEPSRLLAHDLAILVHHSVSSIFATRVGLPMFGYKTRCSAVVFYTTCNIGGVG